MVCVYIYIFCFSSSPISDSASFLGEMEKKTGATILLVTIQRFNLIIFNKGLY